MKRKPHSILRFVFTSILLAITSMIVAFFFFVSPQHRQYVWNAILERSPLSFLITIEYQTPLVVLDTRDVEKLETAFFVLDYYLSVAEPGPEGGRFISIIPKEIIAGFDFTSFQPRNDQGQDNSLGKVSLPAPSILSVDSGNQDVNDVLRDSIRNRDYDVYVKPLQTAIDKIALDTAIQMGILDKAKDNFEDWYTELSSQSETAVVFEYPQVSSNLVEFSSSRFPLLVTHNSIHGLGLREDINDYRLFDFSTQSLKGYGTIQPRSILSSSELFQQELNSGNDYLVGRIVNPYALLNRDVIVRLYGDNTIESLSQLDSHILIVRAEAANMNVAANVLGDAVYLAMSSQAIQTPDISGANYLSGMEKIAQLRTYIDDGNFVGARSLAEDFRSVGFTKIFEQLSDLNRIYRREPTQYGGISPTIDELATIDSVLSSNQRLSLFQIDSLIRLLQSRNEYPYLHQAYVQKFENFYGELSASEKNDLIQVLLREGLVNAMVWERANTDGRKLMLLAFLRDNLPNYRLLARDGNQFTVVGMDNSTIVMGEKLLWHGNFGIDGPDRNVALGSISEQKTLETLFETPELNSSLLPDLRRGVSSRPLVLIMPHRNFFGFVAGKVNALLLGTSNVALVELSGGTNRYNYKMLYQGQISTSQSSNIAEWGLSSDPFLDFFQALSQRLYQRESSSLDLREVVVQMLREELSEGILGE